LPSLLVVAAVLRRRPTQTPKINSLTIAGSSVGEVAIKFYEGSDGKFRGFVSSSKGIWAG